MNRTITLGTGQVVPMRAYVDGIRAVLQADPSAQYACSLEHWAPSTAAEIVAQWRKSVHDRVNNRGGLVVPRDRQADHLMRRLARMIEGRCVIRRHDLNGIPQKVAQRLAHLVECAA